MKIKSISIIIVIVVSFIVGRYSAPEKIKIEEKKVVAEAEKVFIDNQVETAKTTTSISKPDGTLYTRTKTTTKAKESASKQLTRSEDLSKNTEIINRSGVTVSVLAASNFSSLLTPTYGVSVSKPIIGPIVIGAFGLVNGTVGLSLGLML
jgi:hypothetical protein